MSSGSMASWGRASRMYFCNHATARSPMGTKRSFLPLPWRIRSVPRSSVQIVELQR